MNVVPKGKISVKARASERVPTATILGVQISVAIGAVITRLAPQIPVVLTDVIADTGAISGKILSTTVIVAFEVEELPDVSVIVNNTVFSPTLSQSKVNSSNNDEPIFTVSIPQLSVEKLFTCAAVIVTEPVASRTTVKSFALAIGDSESLTFTICVTIVVLPAASVTCQYTLVVPIGYVEVKGNGVVKDTSL